MFDAIKDWALQGDMDGFDTLAAERVGEFDYMNLLKGAGGLMSGAGGMMGQPAGGGAAATPASTEMQRMQLQMQMQAESSARTWKIIGGIALAVVGLGAVALLARPKAAVA